MERTRAKKVNPFTEPADMLCALMAEYGMSTATIAARTKLTPGQVSYRALTKFGIRRAHYRNGQSLGSRAIMKHGLKWIEADVEHELRQRLGLQK